MFDKPRQPRVPQQKRSIEKRARIVEAAFEVFCEKGYNGTSTPDIARRAGLSTGTLYAYFKDKKEIFLECFQVYSQDVEARLMKGYEDLTGQTYLELIERTIHILQEINNVSVDFHKEVMSLKFLDPDVRKFFNAQRQKVIDTLMEQLIQRGIITKHGREKVFLVVNLIEDVVRESVYAPDSGLDYDTLINLCKDIVLRFVEEPVK